MFEGRGHLVRGERKMYVVEGGVGIGRGRGIEDMNNGGIDDFRV